jgi:hypothetical protein
VKQVERNAGRCYGMGRVAAAVVALVATWPGVAGAAPVSHVRIDVLSNRADLISGGDALVRVQVPAGADPATLHVDVDGRDVTPAFAVRPGGSFAGLITGLRPGRNVLAAGLPDGSGAQIAIDDHPIGGPVFAGPQVQPWVCGTAAAGLGPAKDAQCNAPTRITYQYKSSLTGQFAAYDPTNPPLDVATTTTDQGVTVPYIIRVEDGTQDRGLYRLAVLSDPTKPWAPWASQRGWNHKLVVPFGASTAPHHSQDAPTGVLDDDALSRGFMVADSGLNVQGSNANANVSAEALMMLEEHVAETYGSIRYTIGNGCSGGGLQQYMVAAMYPGLLDGIQPVPALDPGHRRPPRPQRLRGMGRAVLPGGRSEQGVQLQPPPIRCLRPAGEPPRRALRTAGLPEGDLGTTPAGGVGAG